MPQIHLSVDQRTATELAARAAAKGLSLSRYLADLVRCEVAADWPNGYLRAVVGSCADDPLEPPEDPPPGEVEL